MRIGCRRLSPRRESCPIPSPRHHLAEVVLALLLASVGACWRAAPPGGAPGPESEEVRYLRERRLAVPVVGVTPDRLTDSFNDLRDGSRRHEATDILAKYGTAVVSVDDGRVYKLRKNQAGGITIYATDPAERFLYYYAHLAGYRAGLREGMTLAKGDVIGYVGTSGNAPRDTPHLHFAITRMPPDKKWWTGTPVDPRPFLVETIWKK
jgi:murein DD-endopeptidase MepM/ murein hydrolase activator NlpD